MDRTVTKMKISNYMSEELIKLDIGADEKFALLEKLSHVLEIDERVIDSRQLAEDIAERERIEPTGIGEGVAIPHARTNSVNDIIILMAKLEGSIEYNAIDGKPINLIFLIGTPKDAVQAYLKLLANLTKLVKDDSVRAELASAATPSDVLEVVKRHEQE
jgi:fructose-specific phosphotransferase system IIA component